jgi:hypothetical protein
MSNSPIPLRCPNPADLGAQPAWPDAVQVHVEATPQSVAAADSENVGNSQEAPIKPGEVTPLPTNIGKRKTPIHLLELIPSKAPIRQANLFEAARSAGINEKYARQFLSVLIADKRIQVRKIPREKAKSALGYLRASPTDSASASCFA